MAVTACQGLGFIVSLIGIAGIIAATCMDQWSTQDLYNNPVTAVFNYQGLWRSCVRESSGFTECRGYFTLLGLPGCARWAPSLWLYAPELQIILATWNQIQGALCTEAFCGK